MRRRQLFHQITEEQESRQKQKPEIQKGQCPYCMKIIGKGIAGHMRGCNGNTR